MPAEAEDDFMAGLLGGLDDHTPTASSSRRPPPSAAPSFRASPALKPRNGTARPASSDVAYSSEREWTSDIAPSSDGPHNGRGPARLQDLGAAGDVFGDFGGGDEDGDTTMVEAVEEEVKPVVLADEEEDDGDDGDEMQVRPKAAPARPRPANGVRRQLVNAAAVKAGIAKAVKAEPVEETVPSPSTPSYSLGESKPKPKGMDWRTATAGLASTSTNLGLGSNAEGAEDVDVLPTPASLVVPKKASADGPALVNVDALEEDGSLRFWWFDYIEPVPGMVCLTGKVKAKTGRDAGKWVSATVTIQGIKRKLLVLPRAIPLDMDGNEMEDEGEPEFDTVMDDFQTDAEERWGAEGLEFGDDFVRRKYAFGLKDVPRGETNWLEVRANWPSRSNEKGDKVDIPMNASGSRYSHVFGTNTTAFELFVVDQKIMGPCWLNIKDAQLSTKGISWTKLEVEAQVGDIAPFAENDAAAPKAAPPLTILSLSARTVLHLAENKRELVCASARVWHDFDIDDPKRIEERPSSVLNLTRSLFTAFPAEFVQKAKKARGKGFEACHSEKLLLSKLLDFLAGADPDVIVGHDFTALELDVLLNRLKEHKTEHWSRIGRFRRPRWPKLGVGRNEGLLSGRLICDLSSEGNRSFIDSTTWSLTEMCETHLKIAREDIPSEDTPEYFDNVHSTADRLLHFVLHCEADCYFQMALAFKVQALPLTRQLTNLAGNAWNRTLAGNRAERNEFILLHRFHKDGFVVPDKLATWQKKAQLAEEHKAAVAAKTKTKGKGKTVDDDGDDHNLAVKVEMKREKFKGGLVFEPQKGLWDRYVLVMDFNSLYPSIIQEYDIDFSTIDWTADDAEDLEKMPDRSPCEGEPTGVLPQLISSLVVRRRNVKDLMKGKGVSPAKMLQYDITQKALKLTANSMYGCLGYEGSRFYARPLAALTTFKGREILTRTKADAEGLGLNVIYGDTDSVMINTNELDYQSAQQIGRDFKKLINDKYKKLEIDTDATFERMLLLNKKKYAALRVDPDGTRETEVKGLDMKRREYSELSKNASKYVLDKILSGQPTEVVVEEIHDYLTSLGENIRAGKVPLEQYIIFKRLGKNPQDYPDAGALPHVQVALRMKTKGQSAKAGDVVPYIFCEPETGGSARSAKAANAYHPDDVRKTGSTLKVDQEVYLSAQVLPPIERLCEHIEGTEKARLAECLGLDPTKYKNVSLEGAEREFRTLQSQVSDATRFRDAKDWMVRCRHCHSTHVFDGLDKNSAGLASRNGLFCPNPDCAEMLALPSLLVQLDLQLRAFVAKFYEGWLVCDDSSCGNRTRMMSVYGRRCLVEGCRGQMHFEYSDSRLYNQLLYFDTLFDVDKAKARVAGTAAQDELDRVADANKAPVQQLRAVVTRHLDKNGRRFVSMKTLFSFMSVA